MTAKIPSAKICVSYDVAHRRCVRRIDIEEYLDGQYIGVYVVLSGIDDFGEVRVSVSHVAKLPSRMWRTGDGQYVAVVNNTVVTAGNFAALLEKVAKLDPNCFNHMIPKDMNALERLLPQVD